MSEQTTQEVSRARFAEMVGCSRAAVTQAAQNGRFSGDAIGAGTNLKLPAALEQWKANKDQRGLGVREDFDDPDDDGDEIPPVGGDSKAPGPTSSVAVQKERAFRFRADALELENAARRGELIGRDAVLHGLQEAGAKIASDLDAIAAWAEELAVIATGDTAAMRAALKSRVRTLRETIAARFEKATEGSADDDDAE